MKKKRLLRLLRLLAIKLKKNLQKQLDTSQFRSSLRNPTGPFTILEPQDQEIAEFYVVQKRRATYFDATNL